MSGDFKAFEYKISLGQNFILDDLLQQRLVDLIRMRPEDAVLEIGSGRGDMTAALAEKCASLVTVEIDSRLEPVLRDRFSATSNVHVIIGDIMSLDLSGLMGEYQSFHVAGNLPYYLTTPILTHLLRSGLPIKSLNVMVQKEAAQRVIAPPGTPEYGPLAILTAYRGHVRETMAVPARCFTPPPKVDSVFLTIPFHATPPFAVDSESTFYRLVDSAFGMRRKTLVNNLMKAFHLTRESAASFLTNMGLNEKIRGEQLGLREFACLSNQLNNNEIK